MRLCVLTVMGLLNCLVLFCPAAAMAGAPKLDVGPGVRASERRAGMDHVVYGFFDDKTGDRIGRLSIGRVGVEYQRQGFLRVAWKPLIVLDDVVLEVAAGVRWPDAGRPIIDALGRGRSREAVLRRLHLHIAGDPTVDLAVPIAQLRADGALLLARLGAAGALETETCFWLAGPDAGKLAPADGRLSAAALSLYVKPTTTP